MLVVGVLNLYKSTHKWNQLWEIVSRSFSTGLVFQEVRLSVITSWDRSLSSRQYGKKASDYARNKRTCTHHRSELYHRTVVVVVGTSILLTQIVLFHCFLSNWNGASWGFPSQRNDSLPTTYNRPPPTKSVHVDFKMNVSGIRLQEWSRTCDEQDARAFTLHRAFSGLCSLDYIKLWWSPKLTKKLWWSPKLCSTGRMCHFSLTDAWKTWRSSSTPSGSVRVWSYISTVWFHTSTFFEESIPITYWSNFDRVVREYEAILCQGSPVTLGKHAGTKELKIECFVCVNCVSTFVDSHLLSVTMTSVCQWHNGKCVYVLVCVCVGQDMKRVENWNSSFVPPQDHLRPCLDFRVNCVFLVVYCRTTLFNHSRLTIKFFGGYWFIW